MWGGVGGGATHHIPPKQTSRATQHFSIRAPRGEQEMDQCSLAIAFPEPSSAEFGEVKEIHGALRALTERPASCCELGFRRTWWRSAMTTRPRDTAPACDRPVNQYPSFTLSYNQSAEQTHTARYCLRWKGLFKESVLWQYLTKVHKSRNYRGSDWDLFENAPSHEAKPSKGLVSQPQLRVGVTDNVLSKQRANTAFWVGEEQSL